MGAAGAEARRPSYGRSRRTLGGWPTGHPAVERGLPASEWGPGHYGDRAGRGRSLPEEHGGTALQQQSHQEIWLVNSCNYCKIQIF